MSVFPTGVVEIVPVTVLILVKLPVLGLDAPIVVLLIVLLVIVTPLIFGTIGGKNGVPAGPTKYCRAKVGSGANTP